MRGEGMAIASHRHGESQVAVVYRIDPARRSAMIIGAGYYPVSKQVTLLKHLSEVYMAIEWTEDLAVGSDVIDGQHREIFRRIDSFNESCREKRGKEELQSKADVL